MKNLLALTAVLATFQVSAHETATTENLNCKGEIQARFIEQGTPRYVEVKINKKERNFIFTDLNETNNKTISVQKNELVFKEMDDNDNFIHTINDFEKQGWMLRITTSIKYAQNLQDKSAILFVNNGSKYNYDLYALHCSGNMVLGHED